MALGGKSSDCGREGAGRRGRELVTLVASGVDITAQFVRVVWPKSAPACALLLPSRRAMRFGSDGGCGGRG
eukprot:404291-Rhodomonas_salina.1